MTERQSPCADRTQAMQLAPHSDPKLAMAVCRRHRLCKRGDAVIRHPQTTGGEPGAESPSQAPEPTSGTYRGTVRDMDMDMPLPAPDRG